MLIEKLSWDSAFFHFPVGSIRCGTFNASLFEKEKQDFDLVYIFEFPGSDRLKDIEKYCPAPADIKVTWQKKITAPVMPANIEEYTAAEPDEQLIELSLQSGLYSRFNIDKHFPPGSYDRLYTEWVRRSTDKTLASQVLVYREPGEKITGFVTLQLKNSEMHIGLIAVDGSSRGQGVGRKLIQAAEYHAQRANFLSLSVSTQARNHEARRLYEKCGFGIIESVHIYHYWKT